MPKRNEQLISAVRSMFDTLRVKIETLFDNTDTHIARQDNPHQVTKTQVGLDQIPNAITTSRNTNDAEVLLTAAGMYDHARSDDHDGRYYTEAEMDAFLALKIDIASIADNLVSTNSTEVLSAAQGKALKDAIDAINALINSDDTTLDEIQEIVDYIKLNRETLESLNIASIAGLQTALDNKVDKITGMGLSANDFTDALLTKLNSIEEGATQNVDVDLSASRGGTTYTIQNTGGTGFTLAVADASNVGLMSPGQYTKLTNIEANAQVNLPTTSSRSLNDAGTVLTAKGMNDHVGSGDHDDRYYQKAEVDADLDTKVDKVTGKALSTEDYTSEEKTKLAGIQTGAQVNVGTNLGLGGSGDNRSVTSSTGSNVVLPLSSDTSAGLLTSAQFNKLGGIEAGAQVNVPSNLDLTRTATNVTVTNSNGSNVTIPAATSTEAGVLSASEKTKLSGIESGAEKNVATDLSLSGSGDTRTLQSSTGNNVSLPIADNTNAGLMSINDRAKLSGIDSGAEKNADTTDARNSDSTTVLLQAKAMNDHVGSGDHDDRYYQKAEVDSDINAVEDRAADYTDTRVAVEIDGVINYNPAIVLNADDVESQKGTGESFENVFETWIRISHNSTDTYPANTSELEAWSYNAADDTISCTVNSTTLVGFISPDKYEDYNFEVLVSSTVSDDDQIGICVAFTELNGREYTLTALRNPQGNGINANNRFQIIYNYLQSDEQILAETSAGLTTISGWGPMATGVKIRAERTGDVFVFKTTDNDGTSFVAAAELSVDLNSLSILSKFKGPQQYGYVAYSQSDSTWDTLAKPTSIDEVIDVVNRVRWSFDGATWISTPIAADEDLTMPKRLYFNQSLETLLLSTDDGVRQIPIVNPEDNVLSHDGDVAITGDVTFEDQSKAVKSSDITRIVKVTQANYPANPEPDVLYVVVE